MNQQNDQNTNDKQLSELVEEAKKVNQEFLQKMKQINSEIDELNDDIDAYQLNQAKSKIDSTNNNQ